MRIEINDFATLQKYQERFGIPFTASISKWATMTLSGLLREGEEEIELAFDTSVLPVSYRRCPAMWAKTIKENLDEAPVLQGYKENGQVVLRVGQELKPTVFIQEVIATLQKDGKISFNINNIPASYQYQPYVFICQLRKRYGVHAKLRIIGNVITYYVTNIQAKTKLHHAGGNGGKRNKPRRDLHSRKSETPNLTGQDSGIRPSSRPITSVIRRSSSLPDAHRTSLAD